MRAPLKRTERGIDFAVSFIRREGSRSSRDATAPPPHPVRFFFGPPVGEIFPYGISEGEWSGRHRECEHNRFRAPSSVPAIYFRTGRRLCEKFVRGTLLCVANLTYGNRYIDRVHSTALLATLDPLGLPSGAKDNFLIVTLSGIDSRFLDRIWGSTWYRSSEIESESNVHTHIDVICKCNLC